MARFFWTILFVVFAFLAVAFLATAVYGIATLDLTGVIVSVVFAGIFALLVKVCLKKREKAIEKKKTFLNSRSEAVSYPSVENDDNEWHSPTLDETDNRTSAHPTQEEDVAKKIQALQERLQERKRNHSPAQDKNETSIPETDIAQEAYNAALSDRRINVPQNEKVYQLKYEDADGDSSKRDITIRRICNEDGRWYIYAYCYLREDYRQFRFDRIAALFLDGKRIPDPQKYLFDLYYSSPEYKLGLLFESKSNELAILIFMARADGAMRKNERDVIVEYIKSISDITDDNAIHEALKPLQVDLSSFNKILKIAKQWTDENKASLMEWVGKIYAVKKAHDPIEEGILKKIQEALKVK